MTVSRSAACLVLVSLACAAVLPGCEGMSESEKRTWSTVGGAAAGAAAGRAVSGKKNKTGGTIIGAVVGGLAGYALSGGFGSSATEEQKKDPSFQKANGEFNAGMEAKKKGDDKAALNHYSTASKMAPDQPEPYNNAGLIYLEQGDRTNAEAMFRKAIAVDPEFEPAKINLEKMGLAG